MAKPKISYESLPIADKIATKKRKIAKLFRELPAEKKQFADSLIEQFAVSTVTPGKSGPQELQRDRKVVYCPIEKPPRPPTGKDPKTGRGGAYEFRN